MYDLHALEGENPQLPKVDAEAARVAQQQQQFHSYHSTLTALTPGNTNAVPRVIAAVGDGTD